MNLGGVLWGTAIASVLLAAGARSQPASRLETISIVATDFSLQTPARARSGIATVRFTNRGPAPHHVIFTRLADTVTLSGFLRLMQESAPPVLWRDVGGAGMIAAGETLTTHVRLAPGRYAISCWVAGADGKPHIMKGMLAEIMVDGPEPNSAVMPRADVTIRTRDFVLTLSAPLRAGPRTIRLENGGPQEHDFQLVRLYQRRTVDDVGRWLKAGMAGPAPGELAGGVAGIMPGEVASVTLQVRPGRYAIFCWVPDVKDGRPHFDHGMRGEFQVH